MSDYVRRVRAKMGNEFLLMPSVTALVFDEAPNLFVLLQRTVIIGATKEMGYHVRVVVGSLAGQVSKVIAQSAEPVQLRGDVSQVSNVVERM